MPRSSLSRVQLSPLLLFLGSICGVIAFTWPLYLPNSDFVLLQASSARLLAIVVAAFGIALVALEISRGAMDSKSVALLGVLSALIAALRLVGAGAIGIEPMWFLLILAGHVYGKYFGFSLGVISMAVSALLTGGIGPWLPFQMIAAGWIGLLAGFAASKVTPAFERFYLIILGILSSLGFGLLMDLQLWPWLTSTDTQLSFVPGAGIAENLERFLVFHLTTRVGYSEGVDDRTAYCIDSETDSELFKAGSNSFELYFTCEGTKGNRLTKASLVRPRTSIRTRLSFERRIVISASAMPVLRVGEKVPLVTVPITSPESFLTCIPARGIPRSVTCSA
jgi:energy-coupling factor transport system substrate-specific component